MTLVFDLYTLTKGEVQYEIIVRGESLNGSETLDQLRAILKNIKDKESIKLTSIQLPELDEEIEIIEQGLRTLAELRQNVNTDSTYTRQLETRLQHYKKRVENIPRGTDTQQQKLIEMSNRLDNLFEEYKTYREPKTYLHGHAYRDPKVT
uniref:Uncharacterized protein n=1 Tax=Cacopsylla melanoneura TaxID=428564 RepID=A0A8D8Z7I3_9HEMI